MTEPTPCAGSNWFQTEVSTRVMIAASREISESSVLEVCTLLNQRPQKATTAHDDTAKITLMTAGGPTPACIAYIA